MILIEAYISLKFYRNDKQKTGPRRVGIRFIDILEGLMRASLNF